MPNSRMNKYIQAIEGDEEGMETRSKSVGGVSPLETVDGSELGIES